MGWLWPPLKPDVAAVELEGPPKKPALAAAELLRAIMAIDAGTKLGAAADGTLLAVVAAVAVAADPEVD